MGCRVESGHCSNHALAMILKPFCIPYITVNAGGNKAPPSTTTGMSAAKLENETEDFKRESADYKLHLLTALCSWPR